MNHVCSRFESVWHWGWHKYESSLIKKIIHVRDELIRKQGSVEAAILCLDSWFD